MSEPQGRKKEPVVEYTRTKGIVGEQLSLRIDSDMTVELHQSLSGRPVLDLTDKALAPSLFEDVVHSFEKEDFPSFSKEYTEEEQMRDGVDHST